MYCLPVTLSIPDIATYVMNVDKRGPLLAIGPGQAHSIVACTLKCWEYIYGDQARGYRAGLAIPKYVHLDINFILVHVA